MEASSTELEGRITLTMSHSEAVVLRELVASSEFSNELIEIELRHPAGRKVSSDVQQVLAALVPGLGSARYVDTLSEAYAAIDSEPY